MSKRIRVLLTISDLDSGGAQRQFSILVKHLSRKRFEPHLCFWRPNFRYDYPKDLPVYMLKKTRPWHVFGVIRDMRRLIEKIRPQLIYSQLHYVNMVTGSALSESRHRARWICRQPNDPFYEMKGPFAMWARKALQRADYVVGPSKGVSLAIEKHLKIDPKKIKTIYNVVDVEQIDSLSKEPLPIKKSSQVFTIVHAGRLHKQKNQALLIKAFSRFRGKPAELWMLGKGNLKNRLSKLARKLGVDQQIKWLGFQKNPFPFLKAADCFVLSSDHEGLPNAVIEAMVCGTPVVSTRCNYGPDELIENGITGFLVPVGDIQKLAKTLIELSGKPETLRHVGFASRQNIINTFCPESICEAYEDLFISAID